MIISPFLASTGRPSRMIVTVSSVSAMVSAIRAGAVLDVDEELVTEHADRRHDRTGNRRPEGADRRLPRRPGQTRRDVVTDVEQEIQVRGAALALLDAHEHL